MDTDWEEMREAKEDVVGEVNSWHGGGGSGREKIAKQKTG